ncbi:peptidoglycan DD-metalloendopeptidase family protein [Chromatocurvus halotolerans]|uniref:Murein DD-endopeptidase MepM/ murein hydrolase activator NlpD n=1 Tax=Chromatocurvus halotolerans TaxID=1132028 RepID=A0A4R2KFP8_9GAMM|nr:peptidoglycan DD-metalloendopeptidase family protein [Chromatocurvus halotolerans]TCO71894.1 murein DD-endopeptidase MepM/ murein hydrolase activator NlpD [Chromatocurvus halotolerans]
MFSHKPARGATPLRKPSRVSHTHLLGLAGITVAVAITALMAPGGDVEANRPGAIATDIELIDGTSGETAATDSAVAASSTAGSAPLDIPEALATPADAPAWRELIIQSGDNLSVLFKRAGHTDRDVYDIVNTAPQGKALERIYPGQTLAFLSDDDGNLSAVRHVIDPLQSVIYRRMDGGFSSERLAREPEIRQAWASGEIESSLFLAGRDAGLSSNLIMELANVFGGVIDFVLDPRRGDTMHVLYEELYLDGDKLSDGRILAASFTNRGETFNAFRYRDSSGRDSFYNEEGVSMRKAFLMAPVDFTRISSDFNLARKHPIYKTTRPHRGTDYAAPRGTPVFASGDGRVIEAGYTRANGNYVFIQHGEKYITKYLHLHKRKVSKGQKVVQSQVIGTVGATGAATGPHLHYEFLVSGVHRNPRTIHKQLPKAKSLAAAELPEFRATITNAAQQLAQLQSGSRLAMAAPVAQDSEGEQAAQ